MLMSAGHTTVVIALEELLFTFDSCVAVAIVAVFVMFLCVQLGVAVAVVKFRMIDGVAPTPTLPTTHVM